MSSESSSGPEGTSSATTPSADVTTSWHTGAVAGLLLGVLGAAVAWPVVEGCWPLYTVPAEVANQMGGPPREYVKAVERKQTLTSLAIIGAAFGIALAVGEGLRRNNMTRAILLAAGCGVIGAGFGLLAAYVGQAGFDHYELRSDISELNRTLRIQVTTWAILCGGVGLGLGLLLKRSGPGVLSLLVAGVLAGALASVVFLAIAAMVLPGMVTEVMVPVEPPERLLWIAVSGGLFGFIVSAIARPARK